MTPSGNSRLSAFVGDRLIARGDVRAVASAAQAVLSDQPLILDDVTGRTVDLDLRGSAGDILARLPKPEASPKPARGRPKLGVTAREITLLPRHWDWLATQQGGASAAIRRLIDEARRAGGDAAELRAVQDRVYRATTTLCGDRQGYEEAIRSLFAGERDAFSRLAAAWPTDVRNYLHDLWG